MIAGAIATPRENFLEAIQAALEVQHDIRSQLCTDGQRIAWLPSVLPGWFRINSAAVKEAA